MIELTGIKTNGEHLELDITKLNTLIGFEQYVLVVSDDKKSSIYTTSKLDSIIKELQGVRA
jgi:hypothetical protein